MKLENQLIESFIVVNQLLTEKKVRYCLIGGIAAGFWGEPRYTQDMDFTVISHTGSLDAINELFEKAGYKTDPKGSSQLMVLGKDKQQFHADFILAETEYQDWVVQRALPVQVFGVKVPICTPEDLVILKMIASRRQDLLDIEKTLEKSSKNFDWKYVTQWLEFWEKLEDFKKEFAEFLP